MYIIYHVFRNNYSKFNSNHKHSFKFQYIFMSKYYSKLNQTSCDKRESESLHLMYQFNRIIVTGIAFQILSIIFQDISKDLRIFLKFQDLPGFERIKTIYMNLRAIH